MNDLLKQLSSYHLFNFILPGAAFSILGNYLFAYNLVVENLFAALFFYYFVGLTISRIGSIVLEPAFKRLRIIEFGSYNDFIDASKKDEKIDTIFEMNNVYRTMVALPLCLLIYHAGLQIAEAINLAGWVRATILLVTIFPLYILAWRKQTNYVYKRVSIATNDEVDTGGEAQ
ncbi:MAG: hypothetical protein AAFW83_06910 [Pseudomonadota bacterium]